MGRACAGADRAGDVAGAVALLAIEQGRWDDAEAALAEAAGFGGAGDALSLR